MQQSILSYGFGPEAIQNAALCIEISSYMYKGPVIACIIYIVNQAGCNTTVGNLRLCTVLCCALLKGSSIMSYWVESMCLKRCCLLMHFVSRPPAFANAVYVWTHMYIYVCVHVHVCICMCTWACTYGCICAMNKTFLKDAQKLGFNVVKYLP